jgi:hypothetical protein
MTSEGRLFKVAAARMTEPSASSAKAASGPAVCGRVLVATVLLALVGCGARDAGELFGAASGTESSGVTSGGAGGAGGNGTSSSVSGGGGTTSSSSAEASASSSSAEASSSSTAVSSTSSGGTVTVVALPDGSTYRYWDKGSVPANWSDPGFDDSGWATGAAPLGYGDAHIVTDVAYGPNANSKYITTWFRTTFDVMNAASVSAATLELMRDDGAMAFLNGTEVARSNLPNGAITSNTLASNLVQNAGQETMFFAFTVDPTALVEGTNVLAIEVHQAVADSSDLGIDARVTLEQPGP